jgi:hypothetical protein
MLVASLAGASSKTLYSHTRPTAVNNNPFQFYRCWCKRTRSPRDHFPTVSSREQPPQNPHKVDCASSPPSPYISSILGALASIYQLSIVWHHRSRYQPCPSDPASSNFGVCEQHRDGPHRALIGTKLTASLIAFGIGQHHPFPIATVT